MTLPKDPFLLLSFVNTRLRDQYASLEELCADCMTDREELVKKLEAAGFIFDEKLRQFR